MELHDRLETLIHRTRKSPVRGKHYPWFRWDRDLLVLSEPPRSPPGTGTPSSSVRGQGKQAGPSGRMRRLGTGG
ncbi:MAG: hypothetical protein MZV70_35690 [Desulfobacterales bacterium]|nr:hypothetical protein [Desulfobacterales bacterium]